MTTGIQIILSYQEMLFASQVGVMRHYESYRSGRKDAHGFDATKRSGLAIGIEGACGEIAVAKHLKMFYRGDVNTFGSPDVGDKYEVKQSNNHYFAMPIRPNANKDYVYIWVTGVPPVLWIRGWMWPADAMKQDDWVQSYSERPSAWFVPVDALYPMDTLP